MIERTIIKQRKKEYRIEEFISETLKNVGLSKVKLQRTPLGEKVIIHTSRPGLVVGRKGESIQRLGRELNESFELDNAQIEIEEVEQPNLDARIVAERIASNLERFGTRRFKAVMHRMLETIMESGALGVEILISGRVPSQRAKRWRVFAGYLKKSGYIAQNDVRKACAEAHGRMGSVGIQVSIMPNIPLPYNVHVLDEPLTVIEEVETEDGVEKTVKTKPAPKKPRSKAPKKSAPKKDAAEKPAPKKTPPKTPPKTAAKTDASEKEATQSDAKPKAAKKTAKKATKEPSKQDTEPATQDASAEQAPEQEPATDAKAPDAGPAVDSQKTDAAAQSEQVVSEKPKKGGDE